MDHKIKLAKAVQIMSLSLIQFGQTCNEVAKNFVEFQQKSNKKSIKNHPFKHFIGNGYKRN